MPKIEVYVTRTCAYCGAVKKLLDAKGVSYQVLDITEEPEKRAWLSRATGQRTVPQVFVDQKSLGGYTDLVALDSQGKLDAILGLC